MTINNGGQAFPVHDANTLHTEFGMTLRDYFAAKAMSGWLASYRSDISVKSDGLARFSYEIADAMIAARGDA